jgi:PKD repeat protein
VVERTYPKPGQYSEILTVTDAEGRSDVDFQVVQVLDPQDPRTLPPSIQAAYTPTFGIRAGDPVRFKVRSFRTPTGGERWDFGDGTPPVDVRSDGNKVTLAPDGFAEAVHRFANPGRYLVRVEHAGAKGYPATAHLKVIVDP